MPRKLDPTSKEYQRAIREANRLLEHPQRVVMKDDSLNQHSPRVSWHGEDVSAFQARILRAIERAKKPVKVKDLRDKVYNYRDYTGDQEASLMTLIWKLRKQLKGYEIKRDKFGGYYLEPKEQTIGDDTDTEQSL